MDKLERLGCLYLTFLNHPDGLAFNAIRDHLPAAYDGDPESVRRKFERDKDELKALGMELKHFSPGAILPGGKTAQGHVYIPAEEQRKLHELKLNDEEYRTLAAVLFGAIEDNRLANQRRAELLESTVAKLFYKNPVAISPELSGWHRLSRVLPEEEHLTEMLGQVHSALLDNRLLEIGYPGHQEQIEERLVEGRGLVAYRGRWCLVAFCRKVKALRSFYIDRIATLNIRDGQYRPDRTFDIRKHSLHPLAVRIHEPQKIELTIAEERSDEIREFIAGLPLGLSQQFNFEKQHLQLETTNLSALFAWLINHPGVVVRLGPETAHKEFEKYLAEIKNHYSRN